MYDEKHIVNTRPVRAFSTLLLFGDAFSRVSSTVKSIFGSPAPRDASEPQQLAHRIRPEPVFPHHGASKRILLDGGLSPPDTPLVLARHVPGAYPSPSPSPRTSTEGSSESGTPRVSTEGSSEHHVAQQAAAAQATGQSAPSAAPITPPRSPSPLALENGSSPFFDGTQTQGTPGTAIPTNELSTLKSPFYPALNRNLTFNTNSLYTKTTSLTSRTSHTASKASIKPNIASPLTNKKRKTQSSFWKSKARRPLATASPSRLNRSPIPKKDDTASYINAQLKGLKEGGLTGTGNRLSKIQRYLKDVKDNDERAALTAEYQVLRKSNNVEQMDKLLADLAQRAEKKQKEAWDAFTSAHSQKIEVRDDSKEEQPPKEVITIQVPEEAQHSVANKDAHHIHIYNDVEMAEAPAAGDVWGVALPKGLLPQKSVGFKSQVRQRPFHKHDAVNDIFESFITDIKDAESPTKVEPEELTFSHEVVEEIRHQPAPIKEAKHKEPAVVVEDVPLLPPVGPKDLRYIIEASEKTDRGRIEKDLVQGKISTHDMKTVLPQDFSGPQLGWLNDNIINEYLTQLTNHEKEQAGYKHVRNGPAPPVHALASQWYASARRDPKMVARWATRKNCGGKNLLDMKVMLLPVCDSDHWRLVAIKPQERTIEYLDSLGWSGTTIVETAIAWLKAVLGDLWVEDEWTIATHQRSGRQLNGSDCGVFTCLNALAIIKNADPGTHRVEMGMREGRQHIAVSVLAGKLHGGC